MNELTAKDLMIGNFVYFNCLDGSKIVVCVTGFEDGIVYGDSEKASHWCNIKKVEPIPISQEILEKNFSSTPDWYFIGTNKYCFRIYKYKDKWDFCFSRDGKGTRLYLKISNVHQLQHALRLAGIDKEIKL